MTSNSSSALSLFGLFARIFNLSLLISDKLNLINTQITRVFSDSFQLYLGIENLTNYRQENTIIASDDPFGRYFDATYVYGPIFGRITYIGLRYYIK